MVRHAITYTCGHPGELSLFGSARSREYAVQAAEKGLCPKCYEAKLVNERAAAFRREVDAVKDDRAKLKDLVKVL